MTTINRLTLFKEIIDTKSKNHTKHIMNSVGKMQSYLMSKLVVRGTYVCFVIGRRKEH